MTLEGRSKVFITQTFASGGVSAEISFRKSRYPFQSTAVCLGKELIKHTRVRIWNCRLTLKWSETGAKTGTGDATFTARALHLKSRVSGRLVGYRVTDIRSKCRKLSHRTTSSRTHVCSWFHSVMIIIGRRCTICWLWKLGGMQCLSHCRDTHTPTIVCQRCLRAQTLF